MFHVLFHVLLWAFLCCLPALVLLPVRWLDQEPRNAVVHESGDEDQKPDDLPVAA